MDKKESEAKNYLNRKETNIQKTVKDKPEIDCEDNWEKYENDVLGIGLCYPKEWGNVSLEPIKDLTLLEGALPENNDIDNSNNNSLFIKFEKGAVELRMFNENYQGERYPNALAYEKGYIDNIEELKKTKNICDYRINFTELWQEQGRMTEFWNQCEDGIKTRIINHEQYFDKSLYSYDLDSVSYLNLQNNFFDHVLITKKYVHISQIEKKINDWPQIFEAKDYPSAVDNSAIISQAEYERAKVEFGKFITSIYSYTPIVSEKKDFAAVPGENEKITLIRKYYWLLENQKLEEAYAMHNRINTPLDEFKSSYEKTRLAEAKHFKEINSNTYKFLVDYQEHNKPQATYRIMLRIVSDDKIEIITTEEITSEMVKFDNYTAYAKKQNGKSFVILEQYDVEIIIDEGVADYDGGHTNLETVKFFGNIRFSESGKYLIYQMSGWEWSKIYIYDIEAGGKVLEFSPGTNGFAREEKSFFVCSSAGMSTAAEGVIYSVPDFKKSFELFKIGSTAVTSVDCHYDKDKNELTFIYGDDCGDKNCRRNEVIYSFDQNQMTSSKVLNK